MTCAWATPASEDPPLVLVCVAKESYTAEVIRETKEFVINIPTKKLLRALWICGKSSGRNVDKFKKARLKGIGAIRVKPLVVEGCIGYIECRLWKTVDAGECYVFFGKVLAAYADDGYLKTDVWTEKSEIPLHLGGSKIVYFKE